MKRDDALRKRYRRRMERLKEPCGICAEPIDYTLVHPHPLSAVVDHVHPLAKGGRDEQANMQAAHRRPSLQSAQVRPDRGGLRVRAGGSRDRLQATEDVRHGAHMVTRGREPSSGASVRLRAYGRSLPVLFSTGAHFGEQRGLTMTSRDESPDWQPPGWRDMSPEDEARAYRLLLIVMEGNTDEAELYGSLLDEIDSAALSRYMLSLAGAVLSQFLGDQAVPYVRSLIELADETRGGESHE